MSIKLKDRDGGGNDYVAIWLNFYVEEENDIIGWFDHDFLDCYSVDINTPIDKTVSKMLFNDKTKENISKAIDQLGIKQIEAFFILYRHYYEEKPGIVNLTDRQLAQMKLDKNSIPYFLGNFKHFKRR